MKKYLTIDYKKCDPAQCDPAGKACIAVNKCRKKLLVQEEKGDGPILISSNLCSGCGKCARVCPCGALTIDNG
jgi:translation initiation factor RLI1